MQPPMEAYKNDPRELPDQDSRERWPASLEIAGPAADQTVILQSKGKTMTARAALWLTETAELWPFARRLFLQG